MISVKKKMKTKFYFYSQNLQMHNYCIFEFAIA